MSSTRSLPVMGAALALFASALVLVSSTAALPRALAQDTCTATGSSLDDAREAYAARCSAPRVDCDPTETGWTCSSDIIGDSAPGGVNAPEPSSITPTPEPTVMQPDPTPTASVPEPTLVAPTTEPTQVPNQNVTEFPSEIDATSTNPLDAEPTPTLAASAPTDNSAVPTPNDALDASDAAGVSAAVNAGADALVQQDDPAPNPIPAAPSANPVIQRTYLGNEGPNDNPMKGWNSGWWQDRPESTVGFQYIRWSDLEPENGVFDFDAIEDIINRPGSRDRHVSLRLYCDWYGEEQESDGCPEWIYSEVGVDRIQGDNGRYLTDYNDPRYIDEAIEAIAALGARYDDDPRMYTMQLGVLGYWGEWHTFGSQVDGSPYEIDEISASRILEAYLAAFDRVHVVGRYPDRSVLAATNQIGFHNDYFRPDNGHSANFDQAVAAGSRWVDGPIGGEIPPGLTADDYEALYATAQGATMIDTGHYSTMKPSDVEDQYAADHLRLHRRLGYTYRIENTEFTAVQPTGGRTSVALALRNTGIAPFYYDWDIQFGLLDQDGTPVSISESSFDLRTAMPGDTFHLSAAIPLDDLGAGLYQVAIRILQPGADRVKAAPWALASRSTYIEFANEIPVIAGTWNDANALIGGWSVLGETQVE